MEIAIGYACKSDVSIHQKRKEKLHALEKYASSKIEDLAVRFEEKFHH